jgi:phosphoglycolate phosphatase-like HAD superfamily hydrolase
MSEADYWRRRRSGKSTQDLLTHLSAEERSSFSRFWRALVESREALALDRLFPGAAAALDGVARDHAVILITLRRDRRALEQQLSRLGIADVFADVISPGEQAVLRKDALPGIRSLAAEGWVVGDTEADIQLAEVTQRRLICVANGVRTRRFLERQGARHIISSVRGLPDAVAALRRAA